MYLSRLEKLFKSFCLLHIVISYTRCHQKKIWSFNIFVLEPSQVVPVSSKSGISDISDLNRNIFTSSNNDIPKHILLILSIAVSIIVVIGIALIIAYHK